MGQAFDDRGQMLGDAFGNTKAEVFKQLNELFPAAAEIRIKSLADRHAAEAAANTATPMPQYQSHKKVWALKIARISHDQDAAVADGNRETDDSAVIVPEDVGYAPFVVDAEYMRKHNPQAGGYFVQYEDGYTSFSPAAAFEGGYTRI